MDTGLIRGSGGETRRHFGRVGRGAARMGDIAPGLPGYIEIHRATAKVVTVTFDLALHALPAKVGH